jgi:hypothetical protein
MGPYPRHTQGVFGAAIESTGFKIGKSMLFQMGGGGGAISRIHRAIITGTNIFLDKKGRPKYILFIFKKGKKYLKQK